ncbi:hypothetical protein QQX98_001023 [Neonectria punicea]|uniref:VOC domain-containing protein n=1 Tax=Neonectria punicea TaxID=979145 RepID=A0ABR1HQQ7_9HYPO
MGESPIHNRVFNHVAVSVCNIEAVVKWYSDLFGFRLLGSIQHIKRSETPDDAIFGIYPASLNEVKLAWMTTGNGVGFEVFEFVDPKAEPEAKSFEFHKAGFFHVCVTDSDPDALASRVEEAGGRRIGKTMDPLGTGVKCLYLADPWGNVMEVLNVGFEQMGCTTPVKKSKL